VNTHFEEYTTGWPRWRTLSSAKAIIWIGLIWEEMNEIDTAANS
jgi:hypothetical protein